MSEPGGDEPRARGRTAVLGGQRAAGAFAARLSNWLSRTAEWLAGALHAEADAGRLAPWLSVCFGIGILFYFAAPAEPLLAAPAASLVILITIAWGCRERPLAFILALALAVMAAGFTAASLRAVWVAHPVLKRPTATITLTGFVETRDATERSDRIVLRLTGSSGRDAERIPPRVRVSLRRGTAPTVGDHVELRARLRPLLGPVRPGGYDYALGAYFARLGATGFVIGKPKQTASQSPVPWDIRVFAAVESLRWALTNRIHAVLPGESGAVSAALITGIRDTIPPDVNEAMRISGLYHVLSISGLHMALVAGTLFIFIRGGLALIPGLALRRPIKKWAAIIALAGVGFYLVLSGSEVATQRSFIMIGIVLVGVLLDRPALTLRTLAAAALGVLALQPEAILNPGFQMSFAATLALVALFERFAPVMAEPPPPGMGAFARLSERTARWLLLGAATSLIAGLATTAYVAFHFHRLAPYGVVANVLALPLISFLIMPAGLVAVILLPFGYDVLGWKLMGIGIDGMLIIARWVAAFPGAEGRVAAFGAGALLTATAGLLMLSLPATRLRLAGIALLAIAIVLATTAPRPDVIINSEGEVVAVRSSDGKFAILDAARDRLASESWLAADADGRRARNNLDKDFSCDARGCIARLADGTIIAVARDPAALMDDCRDAALIVTRLQVPAACAAAVIDKRLLETTGPVALRRVDGKWRAEGARSPVADRPWFGRVAQPDAAALTRLESRPTGAGTVEREAPLARPGEIPTPELPDRGGDDDQ